MIFLIQCVEATTEVVTPNLFVYSKKFQTKLGEELDNIKKVPCTRGNVNIECSTLYRIALDYLHIRNQIRAVKESNSNAK